MAGDPQHPPAPSPPPHWGAAFNAEVSKDDPENSSQEEESQDQTWDGQAIGALGCHNIKQKMLFINTMYMKTIEYSLFQLQLEALCFDL